MIEMAITIGIVLAAVTGVGYGLYRAATGKIGCAGCRECGQRNQTCKSPRTERK